jgi:cell division protease FtsH
MNNTDKGFRVFAGLVIGVLIAIALINLYQAKVAAPGAKTITYSQFLDALDQGEIASVTVIGQEVRGVFTDHRAFKTYAPTDQALVGMLRNKAVAIIAKAPPENGPVLASVLGTLLPMLLLVGVAIFFMRRTPGSGMRGNLGKSRARLLAQAQHRVTFEDVAGVDEAKDSLKEIVDFLRAPGKFQRLGGKIPRGVLLVGPPGTGKTLLARAIAGEADVPFFTISGSDFVEMFVGIGASRVRDLFEQASKSAPCIIFMDEIDAVGRRRGAGLGSGNDEREQTLNQLLVEMDGFGVNEGVILIAATNRPDVLDPALLRPGRFDREIVVSKPDMLGRERILGVHVRDVPLSPDVDLKGIARATPGFSGADLMNLVNEAALLAARRDKLAVSAVEFEDAKDTVVLGAERRTHAMSDDEKRLSAYREGGRAIVAFFSPSADPIEKITIVSRGRSTGTVKQTRGENQDLMTLEQMNSRLAILMGGRASEELVFGRNNITSGTAADIEEATKLARNMVTRWGMSEALGTVAYAEAQEEIFLGHSVTRQQNMSEETAQSVAVEVRKLIDAALQAARLILDEHRAHLELLAGALIERETLLPEEIGRLLRGTGLIEEQQSAGIAQAEEGADVVQQRGNDRCLDTQDPGGGERR